MKHSHPKEGPPELVLVIIHKIQAGENEQRHSVPHQIGSPQSYLLSSVSRVDDCVGEDCLFIAKYSYVLTLSIFQLECDLVGRESVYVGENGFQLSDCHGARGQRYLLDLAVVSNLDLHAAIN